VYVVTCVVAYFASLLLNIYLDLYLYVLCSF